MLALASTSYILKNWDRQGNSEKVKEDLNWHTFVRAFIRFIEIRDPHCFRSYRILHFVS